MDMDALSGALTNVRGEHGSHSGAQAFASIIEMGDPYTHNLPDGSGGGDDFQPSAATKDDNIAAMEIDEVETEGSG